MRLRNHARRRTSTPVKATATRTLDAVQRDATPSALEAIPSPLNASQQSLGGQRSHVKRPASASATKRVRTDRRVRRTLEIAHQDPKDMDPHDEGEDSPTSPSDVDACTQETPPVTRRGVPTDSLMTGVATSYYCLLQTAFAQEDRIDDTSWLTSTLIDLTLWRLATQYADVHFLATDFCHLHLPSLAKSRTTEACSEAYDIRDVLGRRVDGASPTQRPIVFVANVGHIHWNLLRVQFLPHAELQLFEPMGRLSSRSGISYRSVPRCVIEWLDACYPQGKSWITRSVSAITRPQQVSGFDCGVACLLYADKCGQGQPREAIDESTDQHEITTFRSELQRQLQQELLPNCRPG